MFTRLYESASRVILEGLEDEFATIQQRENLPREEVEKVAREAGLGYWKWVLAKWAKELIRLPEDSHRVNEALKAFEKNKSKLAQKDINQYKTVTDIEQAVEGFVDTSAKKVSKKVHSWEGMPGVRVVQQNGPYTTLEITDAESLKKLGEGTKWCTRGSYPDCQAEKYLDDFDKIFTVFESGRPIMQYTPDYDQVMDVNDESVKDQKMLALIPKPSEVDVFSAYNYAKYVIKGRWSEAEPVIAKDAASAYKYAKEVIKGRWPEGEPAIANDAKYASYYASAVIKGRFPKGEPAIANDAVFAYSYAQDVIKGRFPKGEPAIAKDAVFAYSYAQDVIKGRWPEGEPAIAKDAAHAYNYIRFLRSMGQTPAHPELFK